MDFEEVIETPQVIVVCGSSGDGKSELFRRIYASYGTKVRFHLDATHSFDPHKDALPSRRKRRAVTLRQSVPTGALP